MTNLQTQKNYIRQAQYKKGFTLLETLVAIAVMTMAIGAAFSMAQKSLSSSFNAKNQTIAYFLASEGLELVRTVRDNVAIYNNLPTTVTPIGWIAPLAQCLGVCDIEASSDGLYIAGGAIHDATAVHACSGQCRLKLGSVSPGLQYYTLNGVGNPPNSIFSRVIHIQEDTITGSNKKEAKITSVVSWLGQSVSVTATLTNWR